MRKTARKAGAVTRILWLGRPDNPTPIRWMGCWTAVYGSAFREKAGREAERSRLRRGTKKRGKGSRDRRKAVRARGRAARDEALSSFPRAMEKSIAAMNRIDKRSERARRFALGFTARRVARWDWICSLDGKLKNINRNIEIGRLQPVNRPYVNYAYRKKLQQAKAHSLAVYERLVKSEIKTYSRVYGLPFDAARRRTELSNDLDVWRCIPRASEEYAIFWRYRDHPVNVAKSYPPISCRCRQCRFVTECPQGCYVPPGQRTCTVHGWCRHGNLPIGLR